MVTVATKLDVPIKLVFEGPTRASMLGLGDIVLPGIFIALCLRFDHYMYYHRRRKLVPVELKTETLTAGTGEAAEGEQHPESVISTTRETQRVVVKPEYVNPQGQWGDRFWSTRLRDLLLSPFSFSSASSAATGATPGLRAAAFPKTYFRAAMAGYLVAMLTTLAMLLAFNHAQPALLYLVPGVVSAAWLTGAARRELPDLWAYTEDGSLDKEDVVVEVDGDGAVVGRVSHVAADAAKGEKKDDGEDNKDGTEPNLEKEKEKEQDNDKDKEIQKAKSSSKAVVHFSIYPPPPTGESLDS